MNEIIQNLFVFGFIFVFHETYVFLDVDYEKKPKNPCFSDKLHKLVSYIFREREGPQASKQKNKMGVFCFLSLGIAS